jgi:hypothetical protein
VIDPRALQQHFRKVQQRQEPTRPSVPRVPDSKPLTAIEAIPIPEPIIEQQELPVLLTEPIKLVIDVPPPIGDLIIDEVEEEEPIKVEEVKKELKTEKPKIENPYGYSESSDKEDDYDPYGYYSGPRF